MVSQVVSLSQLESAIAVLDRYKYRHCQWTVGRTDDVHPVLWANGDFISANRPTRITLTAFEAVAVADKLEPDSRMISRDRAAELIKKFEASPEIFCDLGSALSRIASVIKTVS